MVYLWALILKLCQFLSLYCLFSWHFIRLLYRVLELVWLIIARHVQWVLAVFDSTAIILVTAATAHAVADQLNVGILGGVVIFAFFVDNRLFLGHGAVVSVGRGSWALLNERLQHGSGVARVFVIVLVLVGAYHFGVVCADKAFAGLVRIGGYPPASRLLRWVSLNKHSQSWRSSTTIVNQRRLLRSICVNRRDSLLFRSRLSRCWLLVSYHERSPAGLPALIGAILR